MIAAVLRSARAIAVIAVAAALLAACWLIRPRLGSLAPASANAASANAARAADAGDKKPGGAVAPTIILKDPRADDQDDMAIWVHPTNPSLSTVIASDKAAGMLLVYDLAGRTIQAVPTIRPGNIDVRYGFPLGGRKVDIVAYNQRGSGYGIAVHAVDAATRKIARIDAGGVQTGHNYGGTLFRSPRTGRFYFFTTPAEGEIEQHELFDDGAGKVCGKKVRSWRIGTSEGAVGDDETGLVYIAEEARGVWAVGGEPDDPAPGKLVIRTGENGLTPDVEGLAIYRQPGGGGGGKGYLLVSSQGSDNFKVYRRDGRHEFIGTFTIRGARDTDGIDVANVALGPAFPKGLFACHSGSGSPCPVLLTPWDAIARFFQPALETDTSWQPRKAE